MSPTVGMSLRFVQDRISYLEAWLDDADNAKKEWRSACRDQLTYLREIERLIFANAMLEARIHELGGTL